MEVLQALAKEHSTQTDTLRAELLVWLCRGDETPGWKRRGRKERPQEMPTDELGRLAAALLDHSDPFVAGLAEWAIAIRLGRDYEASDGPWPNEDRSDWYRCWMAVPITSFLELDYVRQAAALGSHRTSESLRAAAQDLLDRARGLPAYVADHGTPDQKALAESCLAKLEASHRDFDQSAAGKPDELTAHGKRWLALRRQARELVLGNPELDFGQVLFATRTASDNANISNDHPRNLYAAGGDVYVKTGLRPEDRARALIAGRLGPGSFRGLDLWWDADRLVFSYLKQPDGRRSDD